jgi:hypothetical protein
MSTSISDSLSGTAINAAPSQYDRWMRSAGANSVQVDSRTFSELLSFAVGFGRLIRFYDLNNQPDGNWSQFFLKDPTMVLATIDALDLRDLERQFRKCLNQARQPGSASGRWESIRDCTELIAGLARHSDEWLGAMQRSPHSRSGRLFVGHLASAIEAKLGPSLGDLHGLTGDNGLDAAGSSSAVHSHRRVNFDGFSPVWKHQAKHSSPKPHGAKDLDEAATRIEDIFQVFREAFQQLQEFARKHLPETLLESGHPPQIALYIAFVRVFQVAQATLNTLTERFSDFYYRGILREEAAGNVPDSVFLTVTVDPAAGVQAASVPAGAEFPAGKETDGSAILYASDREISASLAALASVRTLQLVDGPLYTPVTSPPSASPPPSDYGSPPASPIASQVLGTIINVALMNSEAAGKGPVTGPIPWPIFGANTADTDIAVTTPVTLGFAIASPYLMLTGGTRDVSLVFEITSGMASALEESLAIISSATGLGSATIFEQVTGGAFDLWLSTTGGWFPVTGYSCKASLQSHLPRFELQFSLSPSGPPVVAFDLPPSAPKPAPTGPDNLNPAPALPTLKAYLRQTPVLLAGTYGDASVFPLSLLAPIAFERLEIRTATTGLNNLAVENSTGTFPVFGGIAVPGSFLQFANQELFAKIPDAASLSVHLSWYGLPQNATGFLGYYQGYVIGLDGQPPAASPPDPPLFDNASFRAEFSVVNPGEWQLESALLSPSNQAEVYLFRTQDDCWFPIPRPDGALCANSNFDDLAICKVEPPSYYDAAESAIRLTLTSPPYAFGNVLYASNVQYAAIAEVNAVIAETSGGNHTTNAVPASGAASPLANAAFSVGTVLPSSGNPSPSKSDIQALVQRTQASLLQGAEANLKAAVAGYGAAAAAWVQQTFQVSGSNSAPYRARTIGKRLQAMLQSLAVSETAGAASGVPASAAGAISQSNAMLNGVIQLQQAMDQTAAEPDATYVATAQAQLSAVQQELFQAAQDPEPAPVPTIIYPNAPWIPQAQGLTVDYRAHCTLGPSDTGYFYLLPFGGYSAAIPVSNTIPLLPVPEVAGILELGFTGLDTAQSLSLLVQMAAGSSATAPAVTWQYLADNQWTTFTSDAIPVDTTNQLQNTGVLTLDVPQAVAGTQTVTPDTYRWLRALTQEPTGFPDAIGIYPNPLTATWVGDQGGSGQHLSQPLPPYTIKSSVQNLPAIQTICQPIESFGGVPAEDDRTFQTRIAERLRHKGRAILAWDYEQLALEEFPTVWQTIALAATSTAGSKAPGHVLAVVVAGPRSLQTADPTEPLVSAEMLHQIQQYLAALASPFAVIQAVNPNYVRIHVTASVVFGGSENGGGGADELNSDLVQYLSPWFYDAERAATRGRYATEDAILQFIETRPYVGEVADIAFQYDPSREGLDWYYLTSAQSHTITDVVKG